MESKGGEGEYEEDSASDGADAAWEPIAYDDLDVGAQIGGGGFALVFEGRWGDTPVAIKSLVDPRLDEQLKSEFMSELFVLSRVSHPHIVELYGACLTPPNLCLVMELVDRSLFKLLHEDRVALSEKEAVRLAVEVASALEYLHAQEPGIIHRDIKSHNMLVTADLHVRLCDFGLVATKVTAAGTPAYMAPELLKSGLFSQKVDVFAFAVLLWELFTQAVPFGSWDPSDIRQYILDGKRLRLPQSGCPKQCGGLIERCWDQDPEKRPQFKNLHRALKRVHGSLRDVSHVDEVGGCGDSFDALTVSVHSKK